ncbi:hypothetical protein, partial [Muricomes intestini]|uniref:hypothetical protein n=1 Tax=Muricomes intestini TaxID=1796634 RepID=UPI002FE1B6D2
EMLRQYDNPYTAAAMELYQKYNNVHEVIPLSSEQIAQVKEAFAPILTNAKGTETVNPISCFFTSYYASPADIDLYQFLYQYPNGSRVTDQAEFEALKKQLITATANDFSVETYYKARNLFRKPRILPCLFPS